MMTTVAGLTELLKKKQSDPDFLQSVQNQLGDYEAWEDEGDTFLTGKSSGVEILIGPHGTVQSIFLFGPGSAEGPEYTGGLPLGLNFGMSRENVRALAGEPATSGEAGDFLQEPVLPWDKFTFPDYKVHIRYSSDEKRIERVTIENPDDSDIGA